MNRPIIPEPGKLDLAVSVDDIRKTGAVIQKIRPAYSPLIEFYTLIFSAQAEAATAICPEPIVIEPDMLALKQENEMPLITPVQFRIDRDGARDLMKKICALAVTHAPKLAEPASILEKALDADQVDLDALFEALLDSQSIEDQAKDIGISAEALAFFGFNATSPYIQACSAQLATYLDKDDEHGKGYCPICGSHPDLGYFDEHGKKQITCSLCSHTWRIKRMGCLFCDSKGKEHQHYFFSNQEKEYRVYYCDQCKNYLKTIDTRELGRQFFPRLEQVATLHLDIKAQEEGYTALGNPLV